uniref:Uncharacterized protein n=1 Tax=Panagrolaimus sp. PS1159 TaxID=55785 RepID=A0AC35GA27_9BILA
MDVLTLHDSNCYSASRMEKLDWKSAQKRCLDLGGSLPLRINPEAQAALRTALLSAQHSPSFYWIGLMGTSQGWKWADGDILEGGFEDWYEDPGEIKDGESLAVVMGRPAGWKWMTAAQSVWNPWICQTKPKFCTSPGVAENGRVVFSSQSYAIGTYSFYSCEPGFQLIGDHRRRCQSDGRWSTKIPVCKPVDCGPPPEWNYGTIHLINGSTAYGHLIEYKCRRGTLFESEENRIRRCGEDSYWAGSEPECIEVDCGQPSPIANGAVLVASTTLNSTAVYSCDENFRLIGHSKSFCSESGHWHPAPPVCYDMLTLKEINDSSSSDKTLILCLVVAILLAILLLVAFKASQQRLRDQMIPNFNSWFRKGGIVCPVGGKSPASDGPRHLVYAAPSQNHDSMIYYAPTGLSMLEGNHYLPGVTEIEVPPHLLKRLPNGNIHVTLPPMRPTVRPSVLNAAHLIPPRGFPSMSHRSAPSPTSSQILYSFDHEPIYDQPPDTSNNIYEELITATQHTVC